MAYVMVIHLFFTIVGLSLLGVVIGNRTDPDGNSAALFGALGLFIGIIVSFYTLFQFIKSEERHANRP
jgi:hypothetical protein